MKNYAQGDYAINKNAKGIIYRFADRTLEVTLEDYLRENPDKTAADFAELKALSDADYYETDRSDYRQTWKNTSLNTLDDDKSGYLLVPSVESELMERLGQAEADAKRKSVAAHVWNSLTEKQKRRYYLYHVEGKSFREIGKLEQANHKSVEESILQVEKKIKKIFSEID